MTPLFWFAMLATGSTIAFSTWYFWLLGGDGRRDYSMQLFLSAVSAIIGYFLLIGYAVMTYMGA